VNIHEYQAKQLFRKYNIPVLKGEVAYHSDGAYESAKNIGGDTFVVKAQIHAGGRGLGGGIKIVHSLDEVREVSEKMIDSVLITPQTSPSGKIVKKVYIEQGADIEHQYYLSIAFDRGQEKPVIIASLQGGVNIEDIAIKTPNDIIKIPISPVYIGLRSFHISSICSTLKLNKDESKLFSELLQNLYNLYMENDAELIEINPLVKTKDNKFIALDAKVSFDENALYRHPKIEELRDIDEEEEIELEANHHNLKYIQLEGNIGCMVNGAGLAMAVMDIIKHKGGEPANFLDIGGGASVHTVSKAFEIMQRNRNINAIFINIFGGIVRCDLVAKGILEAMESIKIDIPLVVRLEGTNAPQGLQILKETNFKNIEAISNLSDAIKRIIELSKGVQS